MCVRGFNLPFPDFHCFQSHISFLTRVLLNVHEAQAFSILQEPPSNVEDVTCLAADVRGVGLPADPLPMATFSFLLSHPLYLGGLGVLGHGLHARVSHSLCCGLIPFVSLYYPLLGSGKAEERMFAHSLPSLTGILQPVYKTGDVNQ